MGVLGDCQELTCTNKPCTMEARDSLFLRGKASSLARVATAQSGASGWAILSLGGWLTHLSSSMLPAPVVGTEGEGGTHTQMISALGSWGTFRTGDPRQSLTTSSWAFEPPFTHRLRLLRVTVLAGPPLKHLSLPHQMICSGREWGWKGSPPGQANPHPRVNAYNTHTFRDRQHRDHSSATGWGASGSRRPTALGRGSSKGGLQG